MKHGAKNRSNARKLPVSTGSELMKETGSELLTATKKQQQNSEFSELSFATYMVSREMWSVQHANEQEICSVAGNWRRQWTTTDLVWCHLYWLGSCQSWYVLTIQFTPRRQADKEWAREKLLKAFKQNVLSHRSGLFSFSFPYSKRMGFEQLRERGWFWVKNRGFSFFFSFACVFAAADHADDAVLIFTIRSCSHDDTCADSRLEALDRFPHS